MNKAREYLTKYVIKICTPKTTRAIKVKKEIDLRIIYLVHLFFWSYYKIKSNIFRHAHSAETVTSSARTDRNRCLWRTKRKKYWGWCWMAAWFPKGKVNMVVVLFFHAACSLRFIGLRVIRCLTRVCVCVIMGIVWINVCNWLSTCCLIVTSWGMLFYECDLLGGLVGIMKQYFKKWNMFISSCILPPYVPPYYPLL